MLKKLFSINASESKPEDIVKLKPILGIRPGVYLAAACALVLLLALFLVLLYPGIARPGAMVVFTSEPSGAALRVDNVYFGTAPCKVFVPQGEHHIEIVMPGFRAEQLDGNIPSRLFASALFPYRYNLSVSLSAADSAAVLTASARDYAAWSFGGEPTAVWQIPLSLSQGVYRAGAGFEDTQGILSAAARFAQTRAALRDLVRALTLAANGGNPPSPFTLTHSLEQAAAFLADNPGSAAWLADTLPADSAAVLISSAWYQNQLAACADITAGEDLPSPPGIQGEPSLPANQIRVGGLLFAAVGSGVVVQGEPFPHQIPMEAFMICTTQIPLASYEDFLDAVPRWHPDQREELEQQELVNSEYLADFANTGRRLDAGIGSISWFAAQAFCEWLSGKLPDSFAEYIIRLPTEAEWEYAAKYAHQWESRSGIFAMDSGAWEWCADPFVPLPFLSAPSDALTALDSPERAVRGGLGTAGTRLNMAGSINVETRASLPPALCSPFVSFRPVIARRASAP